MKIQINKMLTKKRTLMIIAAFGALMTAAAQNTYENSEASYVKSSGYAIGARSQRDRDKASAPLTDCKSGYRPAGIGAGWFLSARAGYSSFIGSPTGCNDFWGRGRFHVDFALGKWLSPYVGLRASWDGYSFKDAGNDSRHYGNIHGDILLNVTNYLHHDLTVMPRWDVVPYIGFGAIRSSSPSKTALSVNPGIGIRYRIADRIYLSSHIGVSLTMGDWDGYGKGGDCDAIFTASLGFTYNIGGNAWKRKSDRSQKEAYSPASGSPTVTYTRQRNDYYGLNHLRRRMGGYSDAGDSTVAAVDTADHAIGTYFLFFKYNSTELTDAGQLVNLRAAAILSGKYGYTIEVLAASDSKTGTPGGNRRLARSRARKIRTLLQQYGVPKSRIKLFDRGGINLYKPYPLNRQAIVKLFEAK